MNLILTNDSVLRLETSGTLLRGSQNRKYPPHHKKDQNLGEAKLKHCYVQFCSSDNRNTKTP